MKNDIFAPKKMPYSKALDDKLQTIFADWSFIERKKMFGGTAYLFQGNYLCGVYKDLLVVRVGVKQEAEWRSFPWCRPMDITGKPMKGWLFVESEAWDNSSLLPELLAAAETFVQTLSPK